MAAWTRGAQPRPRAPRRRIAATAAAVSLAGSLGLSSCSSGQADQIDYAVDGMLTTYNTNTVAGVASGGPQAFARTLTGFNYHGPDGQVSRVFLGRVGRDFVEVRTPDGPVELVPFTAIAALSSG